MAGPETVWLAADVLAALVDEARRAAPLEACGLLIGADAAIVRIHPARNVLLSPTRYEVAPEDHFAALRAARREGLAVIGGYHSHPASAAVPSATDRDEAGPAFLYLIVGLVPAPEVRAWALAGGNFAEVGLVRT